MEKFGALMKSARERRGLTQEELGRKLGYAHTFVGRMESGRMANPPTPHAMRDLERLLGVSQAEMLRAMGYLISDDGPSETITIRREDPRAEVLRLLEGQSPEGVERASQLIRTVVDVLSTRGAQSSRQDIRSNDGLPESHAS